MVLIGVPGSVDSTEVGVFFDPSQEGQIKIDVSSLSSVAKVTAAELIFTELNKKFQTAL